MKVAVSAEGDNLESKISPVFGRCPVFVMVEVNEQGIVDSYDLENSALSQTGGVGTSAAQLIGDEETDVLVTGSIGPHAFTALRQWSIEMYKGEAGTVKENIDKLNSDELDKIDSPTGPAHLGLDENVDR